MSTERKLSKSFKFSYGAGHICNDLCSSMWFTYLLIYLVKIVRFTPTTAGVILLVGQLADAFSTPIVGVFSDKENRILACAKYGRRKIWHAIGSLCVVLSFPFIFSPCLGCENSSDAVRIGYYCSFVILFQFGWACVQISHLALIPELTESKHQNTELNSVRYACTVLSNLTVYAITFILLQGDSANETISMQLNEGDPGNFTGFAIEKIQQESMLGPSDSLQFRNIAIICVIVGGMLSVVFHIAIEEPLFKRILPDDVRYVKYMSKRDWFKEIEFYQVAVLYMATRIYVNLFQVYIPLYVEDTLSLEKSAVASVPFVIYLSGFTNSMVMGMVNGRFGRKFSITLGCVIGLIGSIGIYFGSSDAYKLWGVYIVCAVLGIGGSTLLITCLSITADLIGNHVETGAFVYAFMSFVDKVSNGIVIVVIQNMSEDGGEFFYRNVIAFTCGSACVIGLAVILSKRLINSNGCSKCPRRPPKKINDSSDSMNSLSVEQPTSADIDAVDVDVEMVDVVEEARISDDNNSMSIPELIVGSPPDLTKTNFNRPNMLTPRKDLGEWLSLLRPNYSRESDDYLQTPPQSHRHRKSSVVEANESV